MAIDTSSPNQDNRPVSNEVQSFRMLTAWFINNLNYRIETLEELMIIYDNEMEFITESLLDDNNDYFGIYGEIQDRLESMKELKQKLMRNFPQNFPRNVSDFKRKSARSGMNLLEYFNDLTCDSIDSIEQFQHVWNEDNVNQNENMVRFERLFTEYCESCNSTPVAFTC